MEDGLPKKQQRYRNTNNKYAMNERVRRTSLAVLKAIEAEKKVKGAERRALEKTVDFWKKVFMKKTFIDKKMHPEDEGHWGGKKIIDSVWYQKREQIYIGYAPNITEKQYEKAKQEKIDNASGYLTVNEALDQFPSLKKKYKKSYDHYVKKNKYEEGGDYTEAFS